MLDCVIASISFSCFLRKASSLKELSVVDFLLDNIKSYSAHEKFGQNSYTKIPLTFRCCSVDCNSSAR